MYTCVDLYPTDRSPESCKFLQSGAYLAIAPLIRCLYNTILRCIYHFRICAGSSRRQKPGPSPVLFGLLAPGPSSPLMTFKQCREIISSSSLPPPPSIGPYRKGPPPVARSPWPVTPDLDDTKMAISKVRCGISNRSATPLCGAMVPSSATHSSFALAILALTSILGG